MDFLINIDPVAVATLTFAVIGFVQLYTKVIEGNYKDAGKIVVAAAVGAVFASQVDGITWFNGMLIGLNGSGFITSVTRLGGLK